MRPARASEIAVAAVFLAVALGSCGSTGPTLPALGTSPLLQEGGWELVGGTHDGTQIPLPDEARATLQPDAEQLAGTAFCNSYGADYDLDTGGIAISGIRRTEMACAPSIMLAEDVFLTALAAVNRVSVDADDHLVLTGDRVELRFHPLPRVEVHDLVGTRWVLDALLQGDVAASPVGDGVYLELLPDGTVTGATGCRAFSGSWTVSGDRVLLPTFALADSEADGCPAAMREQDIHVTAVLADGFQPTVEGGALSVRGVTGQGLVYRAAGA